MTDENDSTNDVQLLHSNYRNRPGFEVINKGMEACIDKNYCLF